MKKPTEVVVKLERLQQVAKVKKLAAAGHTFAAITATILPVRNRRMATQYPCLD